MKTLFREVIINYYPRPPEHPMKYTKHTNISPAQYSTLCGRMLQVFCKCYAKESFSISQVSFISKLISFSVMKL